MKFHAQRSLLVSWLKRVSGSVQKSTLPTDMGRYLTIKVTKDKISATVVREDSITNSTISVNAVDDEDLLKIDETGVGAINGEGFLKAIMDTNIDGKVTIESEDNSEDFQKDTSEDGDDSEELEAVGAIRVDLGGLRDTKERFWFQKVSISTPSTIGIDNDSEVIVGGAEFVDYIQRIGVCAGSSNQNVEHSHMLFRTNSSDNNTKLDLVTFEGQRLAWGQCSIKSGSNFATTAPYDLVSSHSRMIDADQDVSIYKPDSNPKGVVLAQEIKYGQKVVGRAVGRLFSMSDTFSKFEKVINVLDFRYSCKVRTHDLAQVVRRLAVVTTIRSQLKFSKKDQALVFSKNSASIRSDDILLPIIEATGDPLELYMSSDYIKDAVAQADSEEITIRFSGKKSLVLMSLSPTLKMFLQPFGKDD